jgi:hypothetical protein
VLQDVYPCIGRGDAWRFNGEGKKRKINRERIWRRSKPVPFGFSGG